jgi:molybdopterin converting factor small subunit
VTAPTETGQAAVTVRYWASARAAAGRAEESVPAGSLRSVIEVCSARHDERLARVLGYCSFLVDGAAVRDQDVVVAPGSVIEVLPPFAGG